MINAPPLIKVRAFLSVAPYLARHGISAIDFCKRAGISPILFQNANGWLPRAQCFDIANLAATLTNNQFAGAQVGLLTEFDDLDIWGQSILSASTVAEACECATIHLNSLQHGSNVRFLVEGQTARIFFDFTGSYEADPQQCLLGSLAVLRKIPLLAGEPSGVRVSLTAASERRFDVLEECFGVNLETCQDYNMIEFDRGLLQLPFKPKIKNVSKVTEAINMTVDVATLLTEKLSEGHEFGIEAIARKLDISIRTLQRRLEFCGVDFEDLIDETRRNEAISMVHQGNLSITDIAFKLGYSDSAHFTRAFRRWTGNPPSRYSPAGLADITHS